MTQHSHEPPASAPEVIHALKGFNARIQVPGDKSMSHRALIFGALAEGTSEIRGLLDAADVRSTWRCLARMGVEIDEQDDVVKIHGVGIQGLQNPEGDLDCGNSGTTLRLLMGVLAGQRFSTRLTGDASLSRRPMQRVADPLRLMGADISLRDKKLPPVVITGQPLQGIDYALPVASAQLKSALILAGIYTKTPVTLRGEIYSRDHTERMLPHFGVKLEQTHNQISIQPGQSLKATQFTVPGDPSTAAFWLAAAALIPGACIELPHVSLNPSRLGFVRVLERMGAKIEILDSDGASEPSGTLRLTGGELIGTDVTPEEIPDLVDEVPLIAVLGARAKGMTEVRGAAELRIKESDRLEALRENLNRMNVELELYPDGFKISGQQTLMGAEIDPMHDHRIAMAFAIAGLVAEGPVNIHDPGCVAISYPQFFTTLHSLKGS